MRKVTYDSQRECLVSNVVGHLKNRTTELVLKRAFEYCRKIDQEIGDRFAVYTKSGQLQTFLATTLDWRRMTE